MRGANLHSNVFCKRVDLMINYVLVVKPPNLGVADQDYAGRPLVRHHLVSLVPQPLLLFWPKRLGLASGPLPDSQCLLMTLAMWIGMVWAPGVAPP